MCLCLCHCVGSVAAKSMTSTSLLMPNALHGLLSFTFDAVFLRLFVVHLLPLFHENLLSHVLSHASRCQRHVICCVCKHCGCALAFIFCFCVCMCGVCVCVRSIRHQKVLHHGIMTDFM